MASILGFNSMDYAESVTLLESGLPLSEFELLNIFKLEILLDAGIRIDSETSPEIFEWPIDTEY